MNSDGSSTTHLAGLTNLSVVAFESRRATEMAELIRRHGGEPLIAPSMREVPLSENRAAFDYLRQLEGGEVDVVILMTGVGLRTLVETVAAEWPKDRVAGALRHARLVARGPKPVAALRELGLQPEITVPEPNTWREILTTLDGHLPVVGQRVAVQEYGISNPQLLDGLAGRGATVQRVAIYRWALPEDLGPLSGAIDAMVSGRVDVAFFTSATQVYHLFQVAGAEHTEQIRTACTRVLIASIGPVCSEALREHGLAPDFEPAHAKMGQLVGETAQHAVRLLQRKRAAGAAPAATA